MDELINSSLDPIVIENISYNALRNHVTEAIEVIKWRLFDANCFSYEMILVSQTKLSLMLKGPVVLIVDEKVPPNTVYILTTKINNKPTIRPLDNLLWEEWMIQAMLGKQPKLSIVPMWAQARIRWL